MLLWMCTASALLGCEDDSAPEAAEAEEPEEEEVGPNANLKHKAKFPSLWKKLQTYEKTYLKSWGRVFEEVEPTPCDIFDAFSELAYEMTGPDGLWRTKAKNEWLRCVEFPNNVPCLMLAKHSGDFQVWDDVQEKLSKTEPMRVPPLLDEHYEAIVTYLDTYVMPTPNANGMKSTRFYQKVLNKGM